MTTADVSETEDGRYIVRFVNGVGIPLEYRCASQAEATTLLEELGVHWAAPRLRQPSRFRDTYRVHFTEEAQRFLSLLPKETWMRLRRAIADRAFAAAEVTPPSRAMLLAAGLSPPALRFKERDHVVVYETDAFERTLTVLQILQVG